MIFISIFVLIKDRNIEFLGTLKSLGSIMIIFLEDDESSWFIDKSIFSLVCTIVLLSLLLQANNRSSAIIYIFILCEFLNYIPLPFPSSNHRTKPITHYIIRRILGIIMPMRINIFFIFCRND